MCHYIIHLPLLVSGKKAMRKKFGEWFLKSMAEDVLFQLLWQALKAGEK